jgi:hypothetical protein
MATSGTQGLLRQSIPSKRTQRTIETIEAYFGTTIGGNTGNNTSSQEISSEPKLGNNNEGSLDKADN